MGGAAGRLGVRRGVGEAPVYVVEGVSKLPQYAYSKRVLFIDKDIFGIPYSDMYDKAGELWKIWINNVEFDTKPYAGRHEAVYPYEVPFAPAIVMVDMQLNHATKRVASEQPFPGRGGLVLQLRRQRRHDRSHVHDRRADRQRALSGRRRSGQG